MPIIIMKVYKLLNACSLSFITFQLTNFLCAVISAIPDAGSLADFIYDFNFTISLRGSPILYNRQTSLEKCKNITCSKSEKGRAR